MTDKKQWHPKILGEKHLRLDGRVSYITEDEFEERRFLEWEAREEAREQNKRMREDNDY